MGNIPPVNAIATPWKSYFNPEYLKYFYGKTTTTNKLPTQVNNTLLNVNKDKLLRKYGIINACWMLDAQYCYIPK